MLYNLFYVSEYKGGELHSFVNLTEEEYIYHLFGDDIYDYIYNNKLKEVTFQQVYDWFKEYDPEWWHKIYAGESLGCLRVYIIDEEKLEAIDPKDISVYLVYKLFEQLIKTYLSKC